MALLSLKRNISFKEAVTLGLGALIGAGIFVLIGPTFAIAGSNTLFVYLLAGISALLSALTYAELASTYMDAGGEYRYTKEIFNDKIGFLVGWLLITGNTVGCAVYALGFAAFASLFIPGPVSALAIAALILIAVLNVVGAEKTARFEYYFTVILTVALTIIAIGFIYSGHIKNFHFSFTSLGFKNIIEGIGLVYISFFGYQVIATSGQEIVNPKKNIPTAIILSSVIASVIYLLIIIGVIAVIDNTPSDNPSTLLTSVAYILWGNVGSFIITILAIMATITSLNATMLTVSRRIYAISLDHYIPELLSNLHPRFRTPHLAILFVFIISAALVFAKSLAWAANLTAFTYLLSLICMHFVLIHSRKKHPDIERGYKIPFYPVLPILGILMNLGILYFLDWSVLTVGILWTILGYIVFELLKRREAGWSFAKLWYERIKRWIDRHISHPN